MAGKRVFRAFHLYTRVPWNSNVKYTIVLIWVYTGASPTFGLSLVSRYLDQNRKSHRQRLLALRFPLTLLYHRGRKAKHVEVAAFCRKQLAQLIK
jgi:hypothetical protein